MSTFVANDSGTRRVGAGGSIDMALTFLEVVGAVVGYTPSVGWTVGANNPLAFERVA